LFDKKRSGGKFFVKREKKGEILYSDKSGRHKVFFVLEIKGELFEVGLNCNFTCLYLFAIKKYIVG
jgi:hypothetical protein